MEVFVDTDCGIDDFAALLFLRRTRLARVVGVGLVHGNVSAAASRKVVSLALPDAPVYGGCEERLVGGREVESWPGHGEDGLGGEGEAVARLLDWAGDKGDEEDGGRKKSAAEAMVAAARECEGRLVVLALGPLTNVAVALCLDSSFKERVSRIVVMGGTRRGRGNSSLAAEFNLHADPEAAARVVRDLGDRMTLVPWETTEACALPWEWTRSSEVLGLVAKKYREEEEARGGAFVMCDLTAAVVCVAPEVVAREKKMGAQVVLAGEARGAILFDHYARRVDSHPQVRVVEKVHVDKVLAMCAVIKE